MFRLVVLCVLLQFGLSSVFDDVSGFKIADTNGTFSIDFQSALSSSVTPSLIVEIDSRSSEMQGISMLSQSQRSRWSNFQKSLYDERHKFDDHDLPTEERRLINASQEIVEEKWIQENLDQKQLDSIDHRRVRRRFQTSGVWVLEDDYAFEICFGKKEQPSELPKRIGRTRDELHKQLLAHFTKTVCDEVHEPLRSRVADKFIQLGKSLQSLRGKKIPAFFGVSNGVLITTNPIHTSALFHVCTNELIMGYRDSMFREFLAEDSEQQQRIYDFVKVLNRRVNVGRNRPVREGQPVDYDDELAELDAEDFFRGELSRERFALLNQVRVYEGFSRMGYLVLASPTAAEVLGLTDDEFKSIGPKMIECRKQFVEHVGKENLRAQNEMLQLFSLEDQQRIATIWNGK